MEDVLRIYARRLDPTQPVVCLDEKPIVLHASKRPGRRAAPGRLARWDYEYRRLGTANVYCIVEPKAGRHLTHATPNRTAPRFVAALQRIARRYREARTIHLVMDNLNLHGPRTLHTVLGPTAGAALWARFTPHYTPKHGSWLNPAEIEASLWARECLAADRVETVAALRHRTRAWNTRANRAKRTIAWRFTSSKARRVFGYTKQSTMSRSKH